MASEINKGADQSTTKSTKVSKDDMSPYMHPIGETSSNKEGLLSFRSKLPSASNVRSGSVSSVYSPNSSNHSNKEHKFNRAFSTSFSTLPTSHSREIVVVNEAKQVDDTDIKELEKLNRIPRVTPLYMNKSLSSSFDHKSALHFCARYQEHIHQCAEAVSFDQNSIMLRIKEVETQNKLVDEKVRERHKKQAKYLEQIQKLNQITPVAERIAAAILKFEEELNSLNSHLPPNLQMEEFSFQMKRKEINNETIVN